MKARIPEINVRQKKRQMEVNFLAQEGKIMDRNSRELSYSMLDDMGNMYKAGAALKSEGIEQPDITTFMKVFDLPGEMETMPVEVYMPVVQILYSAFEDGYRGVKR